MSSQAPDAGRTVLTITLPGDAALERRYTLDELAALPHSTLRSPMPDERHIHEWLGVRLSTLLEGIDRDGAKRLRIEALNDYSALIPLSDLDAYEPILAYRRDGQSLGIAERGPLFVIYPMVDYPELRTQLYFNRTVWQVSRITLE
ncbi:molybdopterin-dependent oxidoreductase [Pseudomonas sp. PDNC002]|uniref:molybdopterin-dependent oxidoreductase n=1 Tax=Pseudomonas sp. PDNC002 TaxID=2811422 RepID=UPI001965B085|nr:molybdopterin-dependent oxidoreductase [Pseudomonas sp. PDNC002]QRY78519.1 molybdopterin-dependent oxidoreductase [Pseudomonas sp. PDNC002]